MKEKSRNQIVKLALNLLMLLLLLLLTCSSESIFSQLGKLQKINREYNILDSSSPIGISLVNDTLYIAAMHLFKKEKGKIEKVYFSDFYEFVNDIVNISGETYLLVQNRNGEFELYMLKNEIWELKFKKQLKVSKFLKAVGNTGVEEAYILAVDGNGKENIFDLDGNNKTPVKFTKNDKFYQMSNENSLITGSSLKIWTQNGQISTNLKLKDNTEIMPIIKTTIRGKSEILVMTGGHNFSYTQLKIYSSQDNYTNPILSQEVGEFRGYFAREFKDTILIGGNSGFAEFTKNNGKYIIQAPSKSVESGSYNGSYLSKTGLNDIIPVSHNTLYILTQGKGLWRLEDRKLTKE